MNYIKCKNLKIRQKNYHKHLYCIILKKEITYNNCANCVYKTIKCTVKPKILCKKSKLNKLERNRFSIITDDLKHCYICGMKKDHLHEIIYGKNRINSIKYGLVIPLCSHCHTKIHNDIQLDLFYKKVSQNRFMTYYNKSVDEFIDIFKKNYL